MWSWTAFERLLQDLRYAGRMMRRGPALTAIAVLSLALGIGANTAIFRFMDAVLLRPLPVAHPDELERIPGYFSYPMFRELAERNQVFSGLLARFIVPVSVSGTGRAERAIAELVSGNYFELLGVQATLGRTLSSTDNKVPMGHPVAVISHRYWRLKRSADPEILGKKITIDNYPFTIIGVAPPGFFGVEVGSAPDVWVPVMMQPQLFELGRPVFDNTGFGWLNLMGRRAPGIGETQARAGLNLTFHQVIADGHHKLFRQRPEEKSLTMLPGANGFSNLRAQFENPLYLLFGVVAIVLLIACANIANLLLARSAARRKEVAVRLAIGAGRPRLVRQFLTESVLLALIGGSAGFGLSIGSVNMLLRLFPSGVGIGDRTIPLDLQMPADIRVFAFTAIVSLITGILFGLAPAIQATRADTAGALKDDAGTARVAGRSFGFRNALVVSQVAFSLLLLTGAGLFLRSLRNAVAVDAGLNVDNVVVASMDPNLNGYTAQQVTNFYRLLDTRLKDLPGVQAVGMSTIPLLSGAMWTVALAVPGRPAYAPGPERSLLYDEIGGDFFRAAGGSILHGRDFGPQDVASKARTAIINESAARYFFGDEEPVGRKVRLGRTDNVEIIGIARDAKYASVLEKNQRTVYVSLEQSEGAGARTVYIRTTGDLRQLMIAFRRAVQSLDDNLPLYDVKTFAEQKSESLARERLTATLSTFFAGLALVLACVGLYGVMAYSVQRRTREIGIRMSLGAKRAAVLWLVLRDSLVLAASGILIGLPLSYWSGGLLRNQLFGVKPGDPPIVMGAALVLLAVAAMAGYLPARRAARVDPMLALRHE